MNKRDLTDILVKELPDTKRLTPKQAYSEWWVNQREQGGFRLTQRGFETFTTLLHLEHHRVQIDPKDFDTRLVMKMDRRLKMPYYLEAIKKPRGVDIIFFGAKEATLAILCETVKDFIDGLGDRK